MPDDPRDYDGPLYGCDTCEDTGFIVSVKQSKFGGNTAFSHPCGDCELGSRIANREAGEAKQPRRVRQWGNRKLPTGERTEFKHATEGWETP